MKLTDFNQIRCYEDAVEDLVTTFIPPQLFDVCAGWSPTGAGLTRFNLGVLRSREMVAKGLSIGTDLGVL